MADQVISASYIKKKKKRLTGDGKFLGQKSVLSCLICACWCPRSKAALPGQDSMHCTNKHTHIGRRAFSPRRRVEAERCAPPYCVLPRSSRAHSSLHCDCGLSASKAHWQTTHTSSYPHAQSRRHTHTCI